ncbi:MAG: type 1 fimbrial protein [Serratia liquefaciens]|nr:type 1 fimbrial protein [Serratia liquefaciens]
MAFSSVIGLATLHLASATAADNLKFSGALIAEPCSILPGDENVQLDFGTVVDKYLYLNQRTHSKPFQIRLTDCDTSIGKTVKVSFSGTENSALPGYLALAPESLAQGVAIGIETSSGNLLALNDLSDAYPLSDSNSVINLQAFVRGEPQVLAEKRLTRGPFTAVATFNLSYE